MTSHLLLQPESKTLEFKRDISSLEPILKTIVAFANTAGGTLIIGRTAEGSVVGVQEILKAEEALANSIADSIRPALLPEIEITSVGDKALLVVKVSHWKGLFYLKREGIPNGVYIRLGSTSRPAGPEILAELQRSVLTLSYDQQALSHLSVDSLDLNTASQFFHLIGKEINLEKLRSLGVLTSTASGFVPSIGGLIFFPVTRPGWRPWASRRASRLRRSRPPWRPWISRVCCTRACCICPAWIGPPRACWPWSANWSMPRVCPGSCPSPPAPMARG